MSKSPVVFFIVVLNSFFGFFYIPLKILVKTFYLALQPGGVIAGLRRVAHTQTLIFGKSPEKQNSCPSVYCFASLVHALYFYSSCLGRGDHILCLDLLTLQTTRLLKHLLTLY